MGTAAMPAAVYLRVHIRRSSARSRSELRLMIFSYACILKLEAAGYSTDSIIDALVPNNFKLLRRDYKPPEITSICSKKKKKKRKKKERKKRRRRGEEEGREEEEREAEEEGERPMNCKTPACLQKTGR